MTSKEDLATELENVASVIGTARDALSRNEILEMSEIPGRIRGVADAISDLPPEDAVELRPVLTNLLNDFKVFAEELQVKIADLQSTGSAATGRSGA